MLGQVMLETGSKYRSHSTSLQFIHKINVTIKHQATEIYKNKEHSFPKLHLLHHEFILCQCYAGSLILISHFNHVFIEQRCS